MREKSVDEFELGDVLYATVSIELVSQASFDGQKNALCRTVQRVHNRMPLTLLLLVHDMTTHRITVIIISY